MDNIISEPITNDVVEISNVSDVSDVLTEISDGNLSNFNIDATKQQIGVFLIAQAQRELKRVIKLTNTLDMLQDKYEDKINEYIENNDDETAITYLPVMIDTIAKCLDRSNNIISKVIMDKNLETINNLMIVTQNNQQINLNNTNEIRSKIEDPASRAKIRDSVEKMLRYIQENS